MKLLKSFLIIVTLLISQQIIAQNDLVKEKTYPFSIGETIEFQSDILSEKRVINVYLPHNYSPDSLKTYPVIYLLDGSIDEDFIHISGLVQFSSFSWINLIPETIVVGIANVDRQRDFTFHAKDKEYKKEFPTTGESESFINFIEKELQPLIEKKYKTNADRTLIGQSLGGLLATEILFKKPELFDNYIIVSPSLWWDNELLLEYEPKTIQKKKSIFVAVGKEGEIMEREAKGLYDKLEALNNKNTILYFKFLEDQSHGDALHLAVYSAFEKVFYVEKEKKTL